MAIILSDETLAVAVPVPDTDHVRLARLETWKANLLTWLSEQVGDPPTE